MTGIGTLDVIIVLAFIFLIYSLLSSIIAEVISDILRLRARNLELYLRFMLSDDNKMRWADIFGARSKEAKSLFSSFIHLPSIKNLSRKRWIQKSGPSYMSAETFVHGLIDTLVRDNEGKNDVDRMIKGLDKVKGEAPETVEHIQRMLERSNQDLHQFKTELANWFDNSMERCASSYKQLVQWKLLIIGFAVAVFCNLNMIEVTKTLASNEALTKQMASQVSQVITNADSLETIKAETQLYQKNIEASLGIGNGSHDNSKPLTKFLGYLLAALGISLGAPFWFDLLGKLVKLRTAIQPKEKGSSNNTDQNNKIKRVG